MAARTKSRVTPKYKTKYRIRNWAAYERALRQRGDITVWFDEDSIEAWNEPSSGRPGGHLVSGGLRLELQLPPQPASGSTRAVQQRRGAGSARGTPSFATAAHGAGGIHQPLLSLLHVFQCGLSPPAQFLSA